jgi:sugar porter (SP) family MFS transporter
VTEEPRDEESLMAEPDGPSSSPPIEPASNKVGGPYVYVIAFIAAAGGFNFGYDVVLMSGAILYLEKYFHLNSWEKGFTMTSANYGALVGVVVGSRLADWLGRKRTLILAAVLLLIGMAGSALAGAFSEWNLYRIIGGVGAGLAALVSPLYISEIAPAKQRGSLVTINQMAIVLGAFLSNVAAYVIARSEDSRSDCWRSMLASAAPAVFLFLLGMFFVPRSPRWLMMKGKRDEAHVVLTRVAGRAHADEELKAIAASLQQETGGFAELLSRGTRMALVIAIGLALFQQLAGVSTLINYAPTVFQNAGIQSQAQAIGNTVILRIWDIFWTLLAMFYVEKLGRRPLLLVGVLGMAVGQFLMGLNFFYSLPPIFTLIVFFVCLAAYDISLAPLAWLIMSEIFPTRIRARGMALAALVMQLSGLALGQVFPPLLELFQKEFGTEAGVFWIYGGFCLAAFVFSMYLVPETKGQTLEQIAAFWSRKPKTAET